MGLFTWLGSLVDELIAWLGEIFVAFIEALARVLEAIWYTAVATVLIAAFGALATLYVIFYAGALLGETMMEIWDPRYSSKQSQVFNGEYAVSDKVRLFFDDLIVRTLFRKSRFIPDCNFHSLKIWLYDTETSNQERGYEIPEIDQRDLSFRSKNPASKLEKIYILDNELEGEKYELWKKVDATIDAAGKTLDTITRIFWNQSTQKPHISKDLIHRLELIWDYEIAPVLIREFGRNTSLSVIFYQGDNSDEVLMEVWDPRHVTSKSSQVFTLRGVPTSEVKYFARHRDQAQVLNLNNWI